MGATNDILTLEVGEITGLEQDMNTATNDIRNNVISHTLQWVADIMHNTLAKNIKHYVYDAYDTKDYPRRGRDGGLLDDSFVDYRVAGSGLKLEFNYSPSGSHPGTMEETKRADFEDSYMANQMSAEAYYEWLKKPIKPHPVHGDALIKRIQTGKGYDWNLENAPEVTDGRPFWNAFVAELKNGAVSDAFSYGFQEYSGDRSFWLSPKDIQWDANEGELEGQTFYSPNTDIYIPDAYGGWATYDDAPLIL